MKCAYLFSSALLLLLLCGCSSAAPRIPQQPQKPLPPQQPPQRRISQVNASFTVADEINTKLRVFFDISSERAFSSKLAQRLAGRVVLKKAELTLSGRGDAVILIRPEFETVDVSGSYHRINCNQISVAISAKDKIYAMTTIEPKALPRKLGAQKAKDQYLAPAVKAIEPFLRRELERLSREEVAVSVVNFSLANTGAVPTSLEMAVRVNKIANMLRSMPEILNFTNIRQDAATATCSFRIVYLSKRFPQGLRNVLNLRLAAK